ncbi:MAG TPA: VanW family protein [Clostridia bacterium]|nr:VanW family protein [Clostridia bacterium]
MRLTKTQRNILLYCGIGGVVLIAAIIIWIAALPNPADPNADVAETPTTDPVLIDVGTPEPDYEAIQHAEELSAILSRATMLEGVSINDIDVSGMTLEEAREAVTPAVDSAAQDYLLLIQQGETTYQMKGIDVVFTNNLEDVLTEAFGLARTDLGYDEVMKLVTDIKTNGVQYNVTLSLDEASVAAFASELKTLISVPATDAGMTVDKENFAIVYTDEVSGLELDDVKLTSDILAAYESKASSVEATMNEVAATLTREEIESQYVLRASFKTKVSGTSNRKYNVGFGADKINGTVLAPNEVFSANDVLGVRSIANGWKSAGAYVAGKHEDQPGGGVCQLSSTLYNCAVLADLEIVERSNHSMPVGYVDRGRDATINSVGNIIDMKFKNNTEGNIIVIGFYTGNYLTFEIYGLPFANDEYDSIGIRTKKISTTKITTEYIDDPSQPEGYEKEEYEGNTGYVYESYKQYLKNGVVVREEFLATSTYRMYPREVIRGTGAVAATPVTTPSTDPTAAPDPTEEPFVPEP